VLAGKDDTAGEYFTVEVLIRAMAYGLIKGRQACCGFLPSIRLQDNALGSMPKQLQLLDPLPANSLSNLADASCVVHHRNQLSLAEAALLRA
jgi:hypothetical protein